MDCRMPEYPRVTSTLRESAQRWGLEQQGVRLLCFGCLAHLVTPIIRIRIYADEIIEMSEKWRLSEAISRLSCFAPERI